MYDSLYTIYHREQIIYDRYCIEAATCKNTHHGEYSASEGYIEDSWLAKQATFRWSTDEFNIKPNF